MGRSGQAAAEFMLIFILFLAALNVAAIVALTRAAETRDLQTDAEADALSLSVASAINTAFLAGDGFRMNITLPATVGGRNYTVQVAAGLVVLNTSRDAYSAGLFTSDVSGLFVPGLRTINNTNGSISVT